MRVCFRLLTQLEYHGKAYADVVFTHGHGGAGVKGFGFGGAGAHHHLGWHSGQLLAFVESG